MTIQKPTFPADSIFQNVFAKIKKDGKLSDDPNNFDSKTPNDVIITKDAREPSFDPTLQIDVTRPVQPDPPRHRLVAIGDSLSHGFQSGAIFNTDISFPAIIAYEMGWSAEFRHPNYTLSAKTGEGRATSHDRQCD